MQFSPLAFAEPCSAPNPDDPGCPPNRFYAYGVLARLALAAAALELEQTAEQPAEPQRAAGGA
jgi:glutamate--cysteine ligase